MGGRRRRGGSGAVLASLSLLSLLLASTHLGARADEPASPAPAVTPKQRDEAIARAFRALDESLWRRFQAYEAQQMFTAAVAGWAYVLAGEAPSGAARLPPRAREVAEVASRLAAYARRVQRFVKGEDPSEDADGASPPGVPAGIRSGVAQYDWPLGMAGCFFAESARRGKSKRDAKEGLRSIVEVLEAVQQENGGWGHDDGRRGGISSIDLPIPDPTGRRGRLDYPSTLLAATNVVTTGLAAARGALGKRDAPSLEKARAYYAAAQHASGGFPYDPSQKRDLPEAVDAAVAHLAVPLAAGAMVAHHAMDVPPTDPVVEKATRFVDAHPDLFSEGHGSASLGLLMGALSCRVRGEATWKAFRDRYFPRILSAQREDGTFDCACRHERGGTTCDTEPLPGGLPLPGYQDDVRVYVTAIHALILVLDRASPEALPPPPAARPETATTPR